MTGVSAADALAPAAPVDSKTDLNQFCQRYCKRPVTKQDIVYVVNRFGHQYQSIVKLNCFSGQEYAGHLCMSSKDAEKSAASQALVAYGPTIETLGSKEDAQKQRKKAQQPLTPEELAVKKERQTQEGENPAITPKTKLNSLCMKIAKRYLQKGETIYDSMKVTGGYQATVRLGALPGAWSARCWAGEVCSTKQKAEQSAAEIALSQVLSDPELAEEASRPKGKGEEDKGKGKGKGKGGKGYWSGYYGGWVWQGPSDEDSGPAPARELVSAERLDGEVVEWKDTYGWIKVSSDIDHPAAGMRRGKIYVAKKDLPEGVTELFPGTAVEFVVYEDGSGLGAGEVTLL
mmetsp:Transcript_102520/g.260407  ORF Transcript_102520/g.260407 Transcript_102520/m.260407 type:complete len:345 (+) Transcript_102520:2-1036(+)